MNKHSKILNKKKSIISEMIKYQMLYLISLFLIATPSFSNAVYAQSQLLEIVKSNPKEANALCEQFRNLNSKGISSTSPEVINEISQDKQLNYTDAEILAIYVTGMYCPDIK